MNTGEETDQEKMRGGEKVRVRIRGGGERNRKKKKKERWGCFG